MKTLKVNTSTKFTDQLVAIIPRNNGSQAGISALQASLVRGRDVK